MLDRQQGAIQQVKAAPGKYTPRVLFALSEGLKDERERAFWDLAAIVRSTVDLSRCSHDPEWNDAGEWLGLSDFPKPSSPAKVWQALMPAVVDWDRKTPREYDQDWRYFYLEDLAKDKPVSRQVLECRSAKAWAVAAERLRALFLEYGATGTWPKGYSLTVVGYNWAPEFSQVVISRVQETNERYPIVSIYGKERPVKDDLLMPSYWRPEDGLMLEWGAMQGNKLIAGPPRHVPIVSDASSRLESSERILSFALHFCAGGEIKAKATGTPQTEVVSPCGAQ